MIDLTTLKTVFHIINFNKIICKVYCPGERETDRQTDRQADRETENNIVAEWGVGGVLLQSGGGGVRGEGGKGRPDLQAIRCRPDDCQQRVGPLGSFLRLITAVTS